MAKKPVDTAPAKADAPTKSQLAAAIKCICAITGCGAVEATARAKQMTQADLLTVADCEESGRRRDAIPIIYA